MLSPCYMGQLKSRFMYLSSGQVILMIGFSAHKYDVGINVISCSFQVRILLADSQKWNSNLGNLKKAAACLNRFLLTIRSVLTSGMCTLMFW